MKYKYFLFDWDGSLGNSLPIWFETFQQVFARYEKRVTYKQIGEKVIGDWEGPSKMGIERQADFFRDVEKIILPKLPEVELNTGVFDIIKKIKTLGGKVAVITTSKRIYIEPALMKQNLGNLVDVVITADDVARYKPDPMPLNRALGMINAQREHAVRIGDSVKDIVAAKNAGIDSVLYYPKRYVEYFSRRLQESSKPTYTIKSFSQLSRFL